MYPLRMRTLLIAVLCAGCSTSNDSAAPPASPDVSAASDTVTADAPAAPSSSFSFPASVAIALDKLQGSEKADSGGGKYSLAITEGPGLTAEMQDVVDGVLGAFHAVAIPASTTTTALDAEVGFGETKLAVHFDFADFGGEGCSGHTAALPVCFRVWVSGERFMAGRFDALPTDASAGSGRLTLRKAAALPGGEQGTGITASWTQAGTDRTLEIWWGVPSDDAKTFVAFRHATVAAVGPDATATKTLNLFDELVSVPKPSSLRWVGRYREDQDLWTGLMEATGFFIDMLGLESFPAACASIATGAEATGCDAAGLSIADVPSLTPAAAADVTLPEEFPAQP